MLIGLVGCGPWGGLILRDLHVLGCEVHVAARHASSQERAQQGGAKRIVASTAELLSSQPDGYVIATEVSSHVQAIDALLPTGRPLFVEKPMCADVAEARRIADCAEGQLFVMDKWRYHPGVNALSALVRGGSLGRITGVRLRRNQPGSHHHDVDAPWTLLPHDLAIVEEILGAVPPLIDAVADRLGPKVHGVSARFGTDPWVVMESFTRLPRKEREVLVFGTEAIAVLDDGYAEELIVQTIGDAQSFGPIDRLPIVGEMPLLAELREFTEFIAGGPPPRAGAAMAARHVEIIQQVIDRAAR